MTSDRFSGRSPLHSYALTLNELREMGRGIFFRRGAQIIFFSMKHGKLTPYDEHTVFKVKKIKADRIYGHYIHNETGKRVGRRRISHRLTDSGIIPYVGDSGRQRWNGSNFTIKAADAWRLPKPNPSYMPDPDSRVYRL